MIDALQMAPDHQLQWLIDRRRAIDLLELEWSVIAAEYCASNDYDRQGYVTPIDCLRISCHMTGPQVSDRVSVGERSGELCDSTDALFVGLIGFGHMVVMARTADALAASKSAVPFNETDLLDQARANTVGKFHHICRHARHAADPQGVAQEEAQLIADRRLKLSTFPDGALGLSGILDPVGGATLRKALGPLARRAGPDDR